MLHTWSISQNSGGGTQASVDFLSVFCFCFLINTLKVSQVISVCNQVWDSVLGNPGHELVWKPLFWHIHGTISLHLMCYPESTFCLPPLLHFSSCFRFVWFRKRKRKKIFLLAVCLKGNFNNTSNVRSATLIWNLNRNLVMLFFT